MIIIIIIGIFFYFIDVKTSINGMFQLFFEIGFYIFILEEKW